MQINLRRQEMRALADAGQCGCENLMSLRLQRRSDPLPTPTAMPCPMNQNKNCHPTISPFPLDSHPDFLDQLQRVPNGSHWQVQPPSTIASRRRAPTRASELKYAPNPLTLRTSGLMKHAVRIFRNYARPELTTMMIFLEHANNPPRGKAIPQQKCRPPTHPAATIPTNHEELSNIEYAGVVGHRGSTRDKRKSRKQMTASD